MSGITAATARCLARRGFDVVYEGIRVSPEQIVASALEEGVHLIGLSILSGSHLALVPEVVDRTLGGDRGDDGAEDPDVRVAQAEVGEEEERGHPTSLRPGWCAVEPGVRSAAGRGSAGR